MSLKPRLQPKTVTLLYGSLAIIVLLVIAAVALVVVPPSPPSVSEFAPQAQEQIDQAPDQQSSQFGSGEEGVCALGQVCEGPGQSAQATQRRVIEKARVRRCVGDPPRQTEDPQSPPCVNFWEGDNGGATYQGVTRDEIRLGWAVASESYVANQNNAATLTRLIAHFNRRYELYGRTLRLIRVNQSEPLAAAVAVDEEVRAFAGIGFVLGLDGMKFQRELARRRVISTSGSPTFYGHEDYQRMSPFGWSYFPDFDEIQRNAAEFTCTNLAGGQAVFAGGAQRLLTRKFAIFVPRPRRFASSPDHLIDVTTLRQHLARCGIDKAEVYDISMSDPTNDPGRVATTYGQLRSDGVTSILLLTSAADASNYMTGAPGDYQPEWVLTGAPGQDNEFQWASVAPAFHKAHMFGAFTINKLLPYSETPAYYTQQDSSDWQDQNRPENVYGDPYQALLVLTSGIQLAGPRLTPDTFASGLQKAKFANPGAGGAPYYQAWVGFGPGGKTMVGDESVVWWSDSASSYHGNSTRGPGGGFCYVGRGVRFSSGHWRDVSNELFDVDPRNCR